MRNIDACRTISDTVATSLGPYGRNKIVINHLQKMILTSDAATILRELEVVHPAAKLLVMASQQQEAEMGDATNMVIVLAGELLKKAEELLRMGLKTSDIVVGYERAGQEALRVLEELEVDRVKDMRDQEELSDNVRVVKIMGGSIEQSRVVKGMVFGREPEGTVKNVQKAKVGVFSCPIDIAQTETKGTVLLKNAQEMLDFTKGEESQIDQAIKELHDSGVRVVVAGNSVGELPMHYLNRYGILVIKIMSKFELRRLCRVVGATPLARLGAPMPDEMGAVDIVETIEIGGDRVTVFRQENDTTRTATLVLRGATQNHLEDVERAVDDGVNVVKAITRDARLVPGAGAAEMQLVERISAFADKTSGLSQYAIRKYAEAFEVVPRLLAESAGLDATEILALPTATSRQRTTASVALVSTLKTTTAMVCSMLRRRASSILWLPSNGPSSSLPSPQEQSSVSTRSLLPARPVAPSRRVLTPIGMRTERSNHNEHPRRSAMRTDQRQCPPVMLTKEAETGPA